MAFRIGQKVACIADGPWFVEEQWISIYGKFAEGPKYDDVVTIISISDSLYNGKIYCFLGFAEYDGIFISSGFRPLTDISVFHEILRQVSKEKETTHGL